MLNSHFPITVRKDGEQIIIKFKDASFLENIKIKAKKKTSCTTKMKGIIVAYREQVS